MKTSPSLDGRQNTRAFRASSLIIIVLMLIAGSCTESEIREYEATEHCFTKESLETVPWIRDELAWFQQPKMSFLRVVVYRYRGEYFLAFENTTLSGPAGHIFNCAGQNLGDLQIHYNEFYDHAEQMAILLNEKY